MKVRFSYTTPPSAFWFSRFIRLLLNIASDKIISHAPLAMKYSDLIPSQSATGPPIINPSGKAAVISEPDSANTRPCMSLATTVCMMAVFGALKIDVPAPMNSIAGIVVV